MRRRAVVLFWGTTAAAVFLLGSAWSAAGRVGAGGADTVVFAISIAGFLVVALIAGRIAFVLGRLKRRARREARPAR